MTNVSDRRVADDLYELTRALSEAGWEPSSGFLGGEFGYGANFENDVFEMHPFWWGECGCGYDERELAWDDAHEHTPDCYQIALRAADVDSYRYDDPRRDEIIREVAAQFGVDSLYGALVHCTCEYDVQWAAWLAENTHDPKCGVARPNFLHKPSGVRVDWYKYIGRDMRYEPVERKAWATALGECTASITRNPDYVEPEPVDPMSDEDFAKLMEDSVYVFEGSLPEVLTQVSETFHPVAEIERLEADTSEGQRW